MTVLKQHAERRDDSLETDTSYQSTRARERTARFPPQLNLAMLTKPSPCTLQSLRLGQPRRGPEGFTAACARQPRERSGVGGVSGPRKSATDQHAFRRSPTRQLPHLGYLQLLYRRGFATVATPVVAPTLTALTHHAHAPTTPTTTQAATSDRHPQSEGSRPGTGMQGYLPQATIAAPKPQRSFDASAGTPKHARQQGQRPPIAD